MGDELVADPTTNGIFDTKLFLIDEESRKERGNIRMIKIAWSAGHGLLTPGKRSPNDEREWSFNNKVVLAGMRHLAKYVGVEQLRVDDPSGKTDVPLKKRTDAANNWEADLYVSCHHNAFTGEWGNHGGVETFTFKHAQANPKSISIAKKIHPKVVEAMKLSNRGLKTANFHELRETNMPAVLIEGGFMDSRKDIVKMRDYRFLKAQGEAIANGIIEYFNLNLKGIENPKTPTIKPVAEEVKHSPSTITLKHSAAKAFKRAYDLGILTSDEWAKKAQEGLLSESDVSALTLEILHRKLLD